MAANQGIYFIASDSTLDLAIAFLNSLREYNAAAQLCLIPYDQTSDAVGALASQYSFAVWRDRGKLELCDELSRAFHNEILGQYRKLCIWEGPFEEFIYIDVDTIILQDVSFVYDFLERFDVLVSHSHLPNIREFVWKDTVFPLLADDQIAFSANTSFIVSRKGALSISYAQAKLRDALLLKEHMALSCAEQPFLNFLIVTSGKRYSSLLKIARDCGRKDIPLEIWSGRFSGKVSNGGLITWRGRRPLLVHWAGEWREGKHLQNEVWLHYRRLHNGGSR
jgi:hypothetical protein